MDANLPRRDFIRLAAGAALLGSTCPLLAQTAAPAASTPPTDSEEVSRLKKQLEAQRAASLRLLIELHDKHGTPITDTIAAFTAAEWRARMEQSPFGGERDLRRVKAELWDKLPPDFQWQIVEDTPTRLRFKVTGCPLAADMKRRGVPPAIGYSLYCASDPGIAAGINPRIRFSRTRTLIQGGESCDHCYELPPA